MNHLNFDFVNFNLAKDILQPTENDKIQLESIDTEQNSASKQPFTSSLDSNVNELFISEIGVDSNQQAAIGQEIQWEFSEVAFERDCLQLFPAEALDQLLESELGPKRFGTFGFTLGLAAVYMAILLIGATGNVASALITVWHGKSSVMGCFMSEQLLSEQFRVAKIPVSSAPDSNTIITSNHHSLY